MRFPLLLVLAAILLVLFPLSESDDQLLLNDDVLGLIVFKSGLTDPLSHLSSWSEDDDTPCSWRHVSCSHVTGRVTQLRLDGLQLSGRIGKGLRKLPELRILSLSGNNFSGDISPEKLSLPSESLRFLDLSRNSLSGQITESLVNASVIRDVDFSGNELSGVLPESLFNGCSSSSSLRSLSLARNFLEGPLPNSLSKCESLSGLDVSGNRFTGSFLSGLWKLPRIRTLDLSGNFFSGPIPNGVSALHYLKRISLRGNQFSGEIPADIGLCPHLITAEFGENRFSGGIPESLRRLVASLAELGLSENLLSGEIPKWIGEMESVKRLDLSGNRFAGEIPATIGGMKSLEFLNLSDNELAGAIPSSLGDCSNLIAVRLSGNSLNGSVPESLFGGAALKEADLSRNRISGEIPADTGGLFSGLEYLNLSWNSLHSEIPPEIGLLRNLTVLDLRESGIYGPVPGEICDSGSLDVLQLDGNGLTGQIPDGLGNCSSLSLLSLSHNNLSGLIPKAISKMSKLKILRLEFNELTGEIPSELGKMESLLAINVSYNRLVGRLPSGQAFQTLDQSSLQGNLGICSPLLKGPCKLDVPKPLVLDPNAVPNDPRRHSGDDDEEEYHRRHMSSAGKQTILSVSTMIAISAAALIVIGVLVVSLLSASARKKLAFVEQAMDSMCSASSRSEVAGASAGKLVLFGSSSQSLAVDPAMLLDKASVVGEGSSGTTVYKVSLDSEVVAMKKLAKTGSELSVEDFNRQVRSLARAQHPNLACIKGYYWTPQVQVLVSEYASEGSLESKLQSCRAHSGEAALPWASRFRIIAGIAKGLAHLHHSVRPPILHYNLKPSNVLLDQSLSPKLSDFGGLAKLRSGGGFGYAAPEMACRGMRVDEKCDVYGFGALTLEVVTGRRPVEYGEDSVVIASDQVRALVEEGRASECVDRSMGDFPEEEVFPVLKLALVCTSQLPSARPSMPEVLHILHVINTPLPDRRDFMF